MSSKTLVLIDLDLVARVKWTPEIGARLKSTRGKLSRRKMSEIVECSEQQIQAIEDGTHATIAVELVERICNAVGAKVSDVLPVIVQIS